VKFPWLSEATLGSVVSAASGLLETARELIGSFVSSSLVSMLERVAFSVLITGPESAPTSMLCEEEANFKATSNRKLWRASSWTAVNL
jgi:hypothetical protein